MRLVLTARWKLVPLTSGPLGSAIHTHRAIVGTRGIEIREPGRTAFGAIHGLRVYPAKTVTGQLSRLCAAAVAKGGVALFAAAAGFLAWDFFFIPPLYSVTIGNARDGIALAVFILVAALTGQG